MSKIPRSPILLVLTANLAFPQALYRGGSNVVTYDVENCNYEPYGVIANFDVATDSITSMLQSMYNDGQRVLRVPLYHIRGGDTCAAPLGSRQLSLDSTSGQLSSQCLSNLTNFLQTAHNIGFTGATFGYFPQGANNPQNWPSNWNSNYYYLSLFNENWALIQNTVSIAVNSGMGFKIDLMNEGIPPDPSYYAGWTLYDQILWSYYTSQFGTGSTVGFSMAAAYAATPHILDQVYGSNDPPVFDLHFYPSSQQDAYTTYMNAWNQLSSEGKGQGWIIGEAWYDDTNTAAGLATAQQIFQNTVFDLIQWPLPNNGSGCFVVPLQFDNYIAYGW